MMLEIHTCSDVGRKRPHNEDSVVTDEKNGLVVLADGMGGYRAGEVASALAVAVIQESVQKSMQKIAKQKPVEGQVSPATQVLKNAILQANSNIYKVAQTEPECRGMGTTVVSGLFYQQTLSIGYAGDSRLYRLRADQMTQVTKDHSLIQELIDRGLYSVEEANAKMPKNLVTRALGLDKQVEVDVLEVPVESGDIYLLCSDGLNDMVNDEEIHLTLSKYSANLVQAAENLVQLANTKGGRDNISVILVRIKN